MSDGPPPKAPVLPAAPEDPMSPEARTAQWILNSVAPNKEMKRSKDADSRTILTPKDVSTPAMLFTLPALIG